MLAFIDSRMNEYAFTCSVSFFLRILYVVLFRTAPKNKLVDKVNYLHNGQLFLLIDIENRRSKSF